MDKLAHRTTLRTIIVGFIIVLGFTGQRHSPAHPAMIGSR
jgi:hypothetical protein